MNSFQTTLLGKRSVERISTAWTPAFAGVTGEESSQQECHSGENRNPIRPRRLRHSGEGRNPGSRDYLLFQPAVKLPLMVSEARLFISPNRLADLERIGFRVYTDFLSPSLGRVVTEVRDRVVFHFPKEETGAGVGYYLKVFKNQGANRPLAQILQREWPCSCAEAEWKRLEWLEEHGFLCPKPAAWGARMRGIWEIDSILVTEELEGLVPLDEWLENTRAQRDPGRFRIAKRIQLDAAARTLSRLHTEGFHHPFPYLRHFFVPSESSATSRSPATHLPGKPHENPENEFPGYGDSGDKSDKAVPVAVLDVHSAVIGKAVSNRDRARGLAELFLSSLKAPLTLSDRLYFLARYGEGALDRNLAREVLKRFQTKLKRHPNRYRWAREIIARMRFPRSRGGKD